MSTPWVGLEPTTPASERAKTVHALDRAAIVVGYPISLRVRINAHTDIHDFSGIRTDDRSFRASEESLGNLTDNLLICGLFKVAFSSYIMYRIMGRWQTYWWWFLSWSLRSLGICLERISVADVSSEIRTKYPPSISQTVRCYGRKIQLDGHNNLGSRHVLKTEYTTSLSKSGVMTCATVWW
jgi:hypothetical protein